MDRSLRLARALVSRSATSGRKYLNAISAAEKLVISQVITGKSPAQFEPQGTKRRIGDVSEEDLDEFESRIETMRAKRELWEKSRAITLTAENSPSDAETPSEEFTRAKAAGSLSSDASSG